MAGRQHEAMFRDDLNHGLRRRQQLAVFRDADEWAHLLRIADLILRIEGRHPYQASIRPRYLGHVFDCRWIHAANRQIQIETTEDLDARYLLADHVGEPGGRVVVILEDDRAHAVRARHHGRFHSIDRPLDVVGRSVHMNVDRAREQPRIVRTRHRDRAHRRQRRTDQPPHHARYLTANTQTTPPSGTWGNVPGMILPNA